MNSLEGSNRCEVDVRAIEQDIEASFFAIDEHRISTPRRILRKWWNTHLKNSSAAFLIESRLARSSWRKIASFPFVSLLIEAIAASAFSLLRAER